MKEQKNYQRQRVGKYIIKALQELGGSASKHQIKEKIVADKENDFSYEDVFIPVLSSKGNPYIPFDFDFNFGLRELCVLEYIEKYNRTTDISLTQNGRKSNYATFPTDIELAKINSYWEQSRSDFKNKKNKTSNNVLESVTEEDKKEDDLVDRETLQVKLLELIKKFTPKKFESFSRKLLSKMGIVFDNEKGVQMSKDHGIDGYGIFESDEFRTSKVVIQCKRFTDGCVSEPEIDKFRGVISKFSADYGIFITTTHFSGSTNSISFSS
ncbi:MAG: restriction endonuclease, partial [Clostridia bacterium]|nr:restriction endonuclease [Clostridia bacterium]